MLPPEQAARRVLFGYFEVNLATGEVFREGQRLRLSGQPAQVLVILLEHAGQLVTREELRLRLWPDETFVDFDHGLNNAINRIRDAIEDSASSPVFIETLPKKGYRFIGEIRLVEERAGTNGNQPGSPPETASPVEARPPEPVPSRSNRRTWLLPALAAGVAAVAAAIWYLATPPPPPRVTAYTQITHDGHGKQLVGTDGSRLYFNRENQQPAIAEVGTTGGDSVPIQVPLSNPWLLSVSSDGSSLLVNSDEEGKPSLWKVEIPGGALRSIIKGESISNAAWSPDDLSVAYETDSGDLYVIASDGSNRRMLVDGKRSFAKHGPVWSPDGSRIRFTGNGRLWEVSPDGSGLHQPFKNWRPSAHLCCGRWSPDGDFYYFLELAPHSLGPKRLGLQFWVSSEWRTPFGQLSSAPKQLTSGPLRWTTAVPGKDGRTIFARGVLLHGELVRFDSESHSLKPWLGGISAESVAFSPDGKSVAYVTFPEGILWRANRDGSNPVQLTGPPLYPANPRWSPDGTQILFPDFADFTGFRIYTVGSQGGVAKALLPESAGVQGDASWSPDGRKIVFDSFFAPSGVTIMSETTIKILDLDSQKVETVPGSKGLYSSRWSPNGRFLAALDPINGDLNVFDFQTQRWSKVQKAVPNDGFAYPTWSSNSQFVYFVRVGFDPAVCRVPAAGGPAERVVELTGFHHAGAGDIWFGLDPEDTPMLLRDIGSDEVYALTLDRK